MPPFSPSLPAQLAHSLTALTLLLTGLSAQQTSVAQQPEADIAPSIVSAPAAGERCFASLGVTTQFSSTNAQAVRDALATAAPGAVVKVAGYCAGCMRL
jgi:hypothetical protein